MGKHCPAQGHSFLNRWNTFHDPPYPRHLLWVWQWSHLT
jgi:hypothetical protein